MDPQFDVELVDVVKQYGATVAVDGISLRVPKASYCCLLGPSGCGKTSTLRMIAGHETISAGDVLIQGRNVTGLPPRQRGTAMMFQSYALFPHLSCLDNVAFSLKMRGVGKAERHKRAREFLDLVDMGGFADRLPAQLSGGQQQRVALGPRADHAPASAAAGRAAVCPRPVPAHPGAGGVEEAAARARHQLHPRHPQPGRGDGAGRPDGGDGARADPAKPARRARCSTARPTASSPASSAATTCSTDPAAPSPSAPTAAASSNEGLPVQVIAVEYQGTAVRVALRTDAGGEASALVPDSDFYAAPVEPGCATRLTWAPADERRLSA